MTAPRDEAGGAGMADWADMEARVRYSPLPARPRLVWPHNARVAVWICPNVMFYEYRPPAGERFDFMSRTPHPEVRAYGHQDFGNRIGFWRLLALLDQYPITPTCALNVAVLDRFPEIRAAMCERDWDYMSHGFYNTRFLFGATEEEERAFHRTVRERIREHTGRAPRGALGPGPQSGTVRTPDLMAEAGYVYSGDWHHDDQPFPIRTRSGRLMSMPYSQGLGDSAFLRPSGWEADDYAEVLKRQFDQLYREGDETGQVMCIALHAYLIAQPHRIRYLRQVLDHIFSHDQIWATTAGDIADYYLEHCFDHV